ncbi:helix-turn-helix transcriptional regulator [Longirhabdus pacifica]|uniref:helix-turn-helix transcriptional regulator n=1 Tax=Longirhabdus pacifica TaxID=2305227 RepID=UPI0010092B85|nr:helix-turn-helix transcriptional regulator [Longirhabdus pacifica]
MKIYGKSVEIKKARIYMGLSQRDLSSLCGLSHPYISLIENSKKSMSPKTAKKISSVLEKDWRDLFYMLEE